MISAKTNDLPGVYFNVMILAQFWLEIPRHTENTFFSSLLNSRYLMTLYNIRCPPSRIRPYGPHGHTVKRYVQPTIFHPARTPEVDCVCLLKAGEHLLFFKTLQFVSQVSLFFVKLSNKHTNYLVLLECVNSIFCVCLWRKCSIVYIRLLCFWHVGRHAKSYYPNAWK